jgi:hypothetical protein
VVIQLQSASRGTNSRHKVSAIIAALHTAGASPHQVSREPTWSLIQHAFYLPAYILALQPIVMGFFLVAKLAM